jgi:hypothetical protein
MSEIDQTAGSVSSKSLKSTYPLDPPVRSLLQTSHNRGDKPYRNLSASNALVLLHLTWQTGEAELVSP